jgi:hypothetical protein
LHKWVFSEDEDEDEGEYEGEYEGEDGDGDDGNCGFLHCLKDLYASWLFIQMGSFRRKRRRWLLSHSRNQMPQKKESPQPCLKNEGDEDEYENDGFFQSK